MFALQTILFFALMLLVPVGLGKLVFPDKAIHSPLVYLVGLCAAFAAYQILVLPCSLVFNTTLTFATALWAIPVAALSLYGWVKTVRRNSWLPNGKLRFTKKETLLLLLVLLVLFVEVGRAVTGLVVNGDDSDYCAQATTALYTNSINYYEPQTGTPMAPLDQIEPHHKISLWAILWASMTQLVGIHPASLMRTFLPIFMIPGAYAAVYLLFKELFDDNTEKALTAVFFLEVAYEVMSCNDGMQQWWLILVSWFGKSVIPNMLCPLLVYLVLCVQKKPGKNSEARLWVAIALVVWAGCLAGASAFTMMPFLLGVFGLVQLVRERDVLFCVKLGCCIVPCVALLLSSYADEIL